MKFPRSVLSVLGAMAFTLSSPVQEPNNTHAVMYGLTHGDRNAYEEVRRDLRLLRNEGYRYLAIEETVENYADLHDYFSGKKTKERLQDQNRRRVENAGYSVNYIQEALRLGFNIIPLDSDCIKEDLECYRDQFMFDTLRAKLPKGESIVVVGGGWHINENELVYPLDGQPHTPLGKYLLDFTSGRNHTILVHSTCIDEIVSSMLSRIVPHPDETRLVACN